MSNATRNYLKNGRSPELLGGVVLTKTQEIHTHNMSSVVVISSYWIPELVIDLIATWIGFMILKSEIQKRKTLQIKFTTIWFKLLSITCISCYVISSVFDILIVVPGFCTFSTYLALVSSTISVSSMSFYQLHRLYYCFANGQIHSNKGYPLWVFITMAVCGVIITIYYCIIVPFIDSDQFHVLR